ncbi:MAG: hypothetical protein JRH20_31400, partial [Deltaproteobacteria bacterium]|nr:hypothetical protein [Deltaproteobacteria bacterium]
MTTKLLALERRQLVSTSGLTILFGAALAAMSYGLVDMWGMALACLPPMVAGITIALVRRWPAMASVTVMGGLLILALAGARGAEAHVLLPALALVLFTAPLLRWRWLLPATLAPLGAYLLLGLWCASGVMHDGSSIALATGITWLIGAALLAWPATKESPRLVSGLAMGNAGAALLLLLTTLQITPTLCAIIGALSLTQGLLLQRLVGKQHLGALGLQLLGLLWLCLAAYLALGALGLVASISVITLTLQHVARRRDDTLLDHVALLLCVPQILVLAWAHPGLQSLGAGAWHLWS